MADVLERRCRLLLLAYPPAYRAERGDEILTTLLDLVPAGRRWPDAADAADIVAGGLRRRFGTAGLAGLDGGLTLAAPVALALAGGIAGFAWWRVEPVGANAHMGGSPFLGVFRTLGPIAYAAWILAAIGWALLRPALSRIVIAGAVAVTLALPAIAPLTTVDRPPLWVVLALSVFGLLALAGSAPASGGKWSAWDSRLAVPAGALAVALGASTVVTIWAPSGEAVGYYYQPTIARVGIVVTATVGVVAAVAIARQVRRRGTAEWLWAAALLGLPAGWMGPFDSGALRSAADTGVPHFGRLAQVVLASCVAVTTLAWLVRRRGTRTATRPPLGRAGAITAGSAVGIGVFLGLARLGLLGFARGAAAVPPHVLLAMLVLVVAGLASLASVSVSTSLAVEFHPKADDGQETDDGQESGDAFRGAAQSGPGRSVRLPWVGAVSAGVTVVLAWLVAVYDNGWTARGWPDLGHTMSLVITIALVPLSICLDAAVRTLATRRPRPGLRTRGAAVVALGASLGWIGYAAFPYVLAWGPVLFVLVICCVAVALSRPNAA